MPADKGLRSLTQYDPFGGSLSVDDPEFEAKVKANLDPQYHSLVHKEVAGNIGKPQSIYSTLGVNFPGVPAPANLRQRAYQYGSDNPVDEAKLKDPTKHVFGIGAGATAQTFAHEFQHDKIPDEFANRRKLVLSSSSPEHYWRNINDTYNYHVLRNDTRYDPKTKKRVAYQNSDPFSAKEKTVLDTLSLSGNEWNMLDLHHQTNSSWEAGEDSPKLWAHHPLDYLRGDVVETSKGRLPRTMLEERAKYPYLNFVGTNPGPVTSGYPDDNGGPNSQGDLKIQYDPARDSRPASQRPAPTYKHGGAIERTTHDRKIL